VTKIFRVEIKTEAYVETDDDETREMVLRSIRDGDRTIREQELVSVDVSDEWVVGAPCPLLRLSAIPFCDMHFSSFPDGSDRCYSAMEIEDRTQWHY
jgi:hypothetical protein